MRILIIGFLAFFAWSTLSAYIYVCKIKGLCDEPVSMQYGYNNPQDTIDKADQQQAIATNQVKYPESIVVYFDFDKYEFNSNEYADKYFEESKAYLEQNAQSRISIIGHTDAFGSEIYNQALGQRRAQSVQDYFLQKGMHRNMIIIESRGENEPVDNNNTASGRVKNRRTVITIKK